MVSRSQRNPEIWTDVGVETPACVISCQSSLFSPYFHISWNLFLKNLSSSQLNTSDTIFAESRSLISGLIRIPQLSLCSVDPRKTFIPALKHQFRRFFSYKWYWHIFLCVFFPHPLSFQSLQSRSLGMQKVGAVIFLLKVYVINMDNSSFTASSKYPSSTSPWALLSVGDTWITDQKI